MARLPQPGGDNGNWGDILNDYLSQVHSTDGTLKANSVGASALAVGAVDTSSIQDGQITEAKLDSGVQTKLNTPATIPDGSIAKAKLVTSVQTSLDKADSALQTAPVTSVNTRTGAITLTSSDVGLGNADNTSDANKPVSTAGQTALNLKAPIASPSFTGSTLTLADGQNIVVNSTTGTKIGTATTQKLGFFNATPVVQPAATTDLGVVLSDLGLRTAGTAYPISTSGTSVFSGTTQVSGPFLMTGSIRSNAATLSASTTLVAGASVEYQYVDASGGARIINLPSTTSVGYRFTIKKIDASANSVTVQAATSIDGAATFVLPNQWDYVEVVSTTTSGVWYVVDTNRVSAASVSGLTKSSVGLGNVDNTADSAKPVSTATQTALNAKADKLETVNTVATSGAAQTIPDPTTGASISRITLTANCTFTFPTAAAGKTFSITLVQDATGSRTVTWPASVRWPAGITPTLTTTANRIDRFSFLCDDGSTWAGFFAGANFA